MDEITITREMVKDVIARANPRDLDFGDEFSSEEIEEAFWKWLDVAIHDYLLPDMIWWATGPRGIATRDFRLEKK